jgi:hypothetical protein
MLVRCRKSGPAAEAIRALMRIRMRCASLLDYNYYWQNPHPGNPKTQPESVIRWIHDQWGHAAKIDRNVIVAPFETEEFDEKTCKFRLYYVPAWPTNKLIGKRVRDDGTFASHPNWIARLRESIAKHGIKDPLLAYCHVPTQTVVGRPAGTPNVVLGNNRVAIAQADGIPTVPMIVSWPVGSKPIPYDHQRISFEDLHDRYMAHRADLWVTPDDWYLVHPPSVFYDETEGGLKAPSPL